MNFKITSRTTAPLVEIIVATCVFAIAAAIAVSLFLSSHYAGLLASDLTRASQKAQTAAETFIAAGESGLEDLLGSPGRLQEDGSRLFCQAFDQNWQPLEATTDFAESGYWLSVRVTGEKTMAGRLEQGQVQIVKSRPYPFLKAERSNLVDLQAQCYVPQ